MLENTFCHIPGIGRKTETALWSAGITSWQKVLLSQQLPVSGKRSKLLVDHVRRSMKELARENHHYFLDLLNSSEQWRMFTQFECIAYIDIETTGLSSDYHQITTIALYDGSDIKHYVHGENLDYFRDDIRQYDLLVTYNGKSFDVPFIRSYLDITMDQAHIDLRYIFASLGYTGGLKNIERQFGLDRESLADVDGFFAVILWHDYIHNDNREALNTLLAYNMLDVVNLAVLVAHAYNLKTQETPFAHTHQVPIPNVPQLADLPFQPDSGTIQRLRGW